MAHYLLKNGVSFVKLSNLPVNGLSLAVRDGLLRALDRARSDKSAGLVIYGDGKNFCAGADITEFSTGKYKQEPDLNMVLASMNDFERPLVAAIDGVALGGGLEVALTCHWRLASPKATVGLPEVHLGILPGAGGTQRLPRIVGLKKALDIMISGRNINAKEALSLGILDELVSQPFSSHDDVISSATSFVLSDRVQNVSPSSRRVSEWSVPGDTSPDIINVLERETASYVKKSGFLAPSFILKAVEASVLPFEEGHAREQALFSELAAGKQAPAMQYAFFAERIASAPPKIEKSAEMPSIKKIGVVGGGTMGSGIAMAMANAGLPVVIVENSSEMMEAARQRVEASYKASSAYKKGKLSEEKLDKILESMSFSTNLNSLGDCDIVIESAFEDVDVKKSIFKSLDEICKPDTILATNSSFVDIDEIAGVTSRPNNVIGTHFFVPANVMKLLEVVKGRNSSSESIAACMKLGKKIRKIPVIVKNCFGFIGNRMIDVYGKEAFFLVEEGVSPAYIDSVLKRDVGMAMGLFEMSDLSGNYGGWRMPTGYGYNDCEEGVRFSSLPDKLREMGWFGQKTRHGWYKYDPAFPRKKMMSEETAEVIRAHRHDIGIDQRQIPDDEIVDRCMLSLVNEGFKILEEGIAETPEAIDVVYVYGYGFPRYRGGPMYWAENERGLCDVLEALQRYNRIFPNQPWFKPATILENAVMNKSSIKKELESFRQH